MKNCIHTQCLDDKELVIVMEIFIGALVAIAAVALFSAFLIPEEKEFLRLGYSPITRYYLVAIVLIVSMVISGARAVKKSWSWCRSCRQAGKSLCFCGRPLLVERDYHLEQFLFITVFSGLVGRCPSCGISFPVGRQQKIFGWHCQ